MILAGFSTGGVGRGSTQGVKVTGVPAWAMPFRMMNGAAVIPAPAASPVVSSVRRFIVISCFDLLWNITNLISKPCS